MPNRGPASPAVCAVDIGTSAIRAAAVLADGQITALARRDRDSGSASTTFDPEELWTQTAAVLRTLTGQLDPGTLRGLAVTAHVGAVIADQDGKAVWDGFGWADTRGVDLLTLAWAELPDPFGITGRPVVTGGGLPALAWLRTRHPEAFRRARWLLSPKDMVLHRLTGAIVTDVTSAAYTLALDVRSRGWARDLCAASGIDPALLPPIRDADRVVGTVSQDAARRSGLPEGLPVVAGGPDGSVGAAVLADAGTAAIMDVAGTTDVVTRLSRGFPADPPPGALVNPYLSDGLYSAGGPTGMTGGAASFLGGLLNLGGMDTAMERFGPRVEALPPGSGGLVVLPSLTGARFPRWLPAERGGVLGLTDQHTAIHVLRAAHEAAAFVVRECADLLDGTGDRIPVRLAGGAARSPWLAQLRADVLGRTVCACAEPETGLLGAAILAATGCGLHASFGAARARMAPGLREVRPDQGRARRYDELYPAWLALRRAAMPEATGADRT